MGLKSEINSATRLHLQCGSQIHIFTIETNINRTFCRISDTYTHKMLKKYQNHIQTTFYAKKLAT